MQHNQASSHSQSSIISDHANTIVAFNRFLHDKTFNDDRAGLSIDVSDLLYDLFSKWSASNQTTQRWKNPEPKDFGDIIFIHAFDNAANVPLQIGMNKTGIFLEMGMASPENLPLMPDTFWQHWLDLSRFGDFELLENEVFSDNETRQHPSIFPGSTSNIYRLMCSLIAFPILYERSMVLGNLSVSWPYEKYSVAEVISNGTLAFNSLCQLNSWLSK